MRILQVNKFFFEKGGTERYLFALSDALEQRGHQVVHFSMQHPRNRMSAYSEYFIAQRDLGGTRGGVQDAPKGLSFIRSREAATKIGDLIAHARPDVAHLHNIYHQITPSIVPVLRRAGIPVVMTLHDYKLICPNYSLFDGKQYCYRCRGGEFYHAMLVRCNARSFARSAMLSIEAYWQRGTRVYDKIRYLLAPSRFMRETFLGEGYDAERVVYLPHFVPPTAADEVAADASAAPPDLPNNYLLYFGRLSAEKGLLTLLEAHRRLDGIPLVIAGDGPLRDEMARRVSAHGAKNVHLTGYLAGPALERVVRAARAVVIPTESPENAPFTALESMAAGKALIVSHMGGLPELVEKTGGAVFTAGNVEELGGRIRRFWEDDALTRDCGERGRRIALEEFTVDRHMRRIEDIYERATGRVAGRSEETA